MTKLIYIQLNCLDNFVVSFIKVSVNKKTKANILKNVDIFLAMYIHT